MFTAVVHSQWKRSRVIIAVGAVAAFALPVLSLQGVAGADPLETSALLGAIQAWGTLYPVLAATLGLLVAGATWAGDHRGGHVHALSLPLARWRYVLLRFAGGATLLAVPALAVFAGAVLATALASLPPGLQAYPLALGSRFGLAVLVAYAVFFAVSAGTTRTAGIILGAIAAILIVHVLASVAGLDLDLPGRVGNAVLAWPGPLAIFTGRWMLVDV